MQFFGHRWPSAKPDTVHVINRQQGAKEKNEMLQILVAVLTAEEKLQVFPVAVSEACS